MYTLPYFVKIKMRYLMRSDGGSISKILHELLIHEDTDLTFHAGPSSWRRYIEVAFHFGRLQSTRLKDS